MFIDPLVHLLFFNFAHILVLVTFHAHAQINGIFGLAVRSVPHIVSLAFPARKELGVNNMVAAHAIRPASTWATTAEFRFGFLDDFVATYFCLANEIPKVRVSFVTYYRSFGELVGCVGIYLEMVPCGADDFIKVR